MESIHINHLAVITAALSAFLLGSLWYSPVMFVRAWQKECGLTDEKLKEGNMVKIFGFSFIFLLVMAYNLAFFVGNPSIDTTTALGYGFLTGFGWIAMAIFVLGLFEHRSWRYMLINGGYMVVALTIMGTILGAWK